MPQNTKSEHMRTVKQVAVLLNVPRNLLYCKLRELNITPKKRLSEPVITRLGGVVRRYRKFVSVLSDEQINQLRDALCKQKR